MASEHFKIAGLINPGLIFTIEFVFVLQNVISSVLTSCPVSEDYSERQYYNAYSEVMKP